MRGYGRRGPGRWIALALALLLGWAGVRLADRALMEPLQAMALAEARALATAAINRVAEEELARSTGYADLIRVVPDAQGRVAMLQADTLAMSRVVSRTASAVAAEMRRLGEVRVYLPLGRLTGLALLGTSGPRVPVTLVPTGVATAQVRHDFRDAGINQTRHVVLLRVQATVQVVFPFVSREVAVESELPLAEAVIVGQVPQFFWRSDRPPG